MIVLGIDPGLATTGYGVIEYISKSEVLEYGTIQTSPSESRYLRFKKLGTRFEEIIKKFRPDVAAIESVFFNTNVKTAIITGEVKGALILTCVNNGVEIAEYTPLQVKQGIVGYGRAIKTQVQMMLKVLLGLKEIPEPDDAADALAIALTHIHLHGQDSRIKKQR